MAGPQLTPDNALRLHLTKAREYWQEDRLDLADAAIRNALRVGIPSGDWYDLQRTIEAEYGARKSAVRESLSENLILEGTPDVSGDQWLMIQPTAAHALEVVTESLQINWSVPVLLALIPSDEWVEFMRARYGYYARRTASHKLCLPPSACRPMRLFAHACRHEMTHAAVDELAGDRVPRWLNEGMAVLMEGSPPTPNIGGVKPRMRLDEISAGFESFAVDIGGPLSHRCYQQAGAFVGQLRDRFGIEGLRAALESIGGGRSPDRAFRNSVGISLRDLERDWRDESRS